MWYDLQKKVFQLMPYSPFFASSRKDEEDDKPGFILLPVPPFLSRTTVFVLLAKWFPTVFSFVSVGSDEDNHYSNEHISEMEVRLKTAEKEKEELEKEVELILSQLEESNAEKSKLEKMHDKLAEEIEVSLRISSDLYNNFL